VSDGVMYVQCYDRLCQWDKMETVCHHLLSASAASAHDVSLDLVWQQTGNQVSCPPCLCSVVLLSSNGCPM